MKIDEMTWICHICGEERPDDKISVINKPMRFDNNVIGQQNIRYCNDKQECFEGTKDFSFLKNE